MKLTCANCAYRNRSIDQWPCDSCRDVGGVMSMFVPDSNTDKDSSCNDDYCEIKFEEE
jgi:hypothetical protein